jgi:hypothetical protein
VGTRKWWTVPVAACLFFGVIVGADLYEIHHPRGEPVDVPWWTGVLYLGGVLNLSWWLGLARICAAVVAGALVGSWWALPVAALVVPDIEIVRAADDAYYFGPNRLPAYVYVGETVIFAALIAFGVLVANPRLRARLRGVREPHRLERFGRHPYPQGIAIRDAHGEEIHEIRED